MSAVLDSAGLNPAELRIGQAYSYVLPMAERNTPLVFRYLPGGSLDPAQGIVLRRAEQLAVLWRLPDYPCLAGLLSGQRSIPTQRQETLLATGMDDILIFGAHRVGAHLAQIQRGSGGKVVAFLDNDPTKQNSHLANVPILAPGAVAPDSLPLVLGSGQHSAALERELRERGWTRLLSMQEFLFSRAAPYAAEEDFRQYSWRVVEQLPAFLSAFLCLDDETSRRTFDALLEMRMGLGHFSASLKTPADDEYLEDVYIQPQDARFYVDGGAYTGDTLDRIERRFGPVERAYLFEPQRSAFLEGQRRYADRTGIRFFQAGLSAASCELQMPEINSCDTLEEIPAAASASASGVPGVRLDEVVEGRVGLIKLDIEGGEESALRGAADILRREHPKLSVCAYHRGDDLWRLIDTVLGIDDRYRVGLRHHSDIIDDTTLYFY
ncbi:FkbM family methyltransferase [Pseudomonas oryzihabitans]|uniref:FkbM family methyltransferase n=1 Tax=Pseudomonas oryzihabitans TaxID=47885 RepID=UPI001643BDC3|nr:FkbM family methyltransferase [Pseudomonas oryzihabitans]